MKNSFVFPFWSTFLFLVFSPFFALDSDACTCIPDSNRSLCTLGDEADAGQNSNFLAVVKLTSVSNSGGIATYTLEVLEFLGGTQPTGDVFLVQMDGATCSQYDIIDLGVTGVLSGFHANGQLFPSFCQLERSLFRMNMDTVFVPHYTPSVGFVDEPYTLAEFRSGSCAEVSDIGKVTPADEAFSLSYDWHNEELEIVVLDPSIRSENLAVSIYSANGQHLLEVKPSGPIDVSSMPPGMYAILIRNEQQAWSKAFVKPN
ncbi:MAG: T9SS type A sorting domain-containing protein [Saprospiraceae bacterium]